MPRSESKPLRTAAEVIEALGHAHVVALTGKSYKRVWDWGRDGSFPSRYFAVMWLELAGRGYTAPPALWGQTLSRNKEVMLTAIARQIGAAA